MGYVVTYQKEVFEIKTFDGETTLLEFLLEEFGVVDYKIGHNLISGQDIYINQYENIEKEVDFETTDDT